VSYTVAVLIGVAVIICVDVAVTRVRLVGRRSFWTAYAIVLGFQLLVNGLLTGVPIVRYRPSAIIGWRFAYAPVEDLLFGFGLVLLTLTIWVALGRRDRGRRANHELMSPRPATSARRRRPTDTRPDSTS
jgi:lycopene cyclase domain-containing protein